MKTIKAKILVSMILTVSLSLALVGGIACFLGYQGTQSAIETSIHETASIAAERVSYHLQKYMTVAKEAGTVARIANPQTPLADKQALLQQKVDTYGLQRYNLLNTQGVSVFDGNDYSSRAYFKESMKGKAWVSEPLISAVTGELTIIISAPLWKDGIANSEIVGVVYFVPPETFLNDIVANIQISENGAAYMLDAQGNTIAHRNAESVYNQENTIEDAKTDSSLADLAAIESKMISGAAGFGQYTYDGTAKLIAYAPVPDSNGWSLAINAPMSDFTEASIRGVLVTIALLVLAVIASSLVALRLATGIGEPIRACTDRLNLLSQGNLDAPIPDIHSNDESGELVASTKIIVSALSTIVKDIDQFLNQMGSGNFTADSQVAELYIGSFVPLLGSMRQIKGRLNDTLLQIHVSADQISTGAAQVSDGAQSLAQGSTEQASAVQELTATIHEISDNAQKTAEVSKRSQGRAEQAGGEVVRSNELMRDLTVAMEDINESSRKISNIITTIEDIAFQTNILALNAAVEAARAGTAGKGFSVVADEVRSLASKSDQAAKETKELIESSVKSIESGNKILNEVTGSLQKTTDLAGLAVGDMVTVAGMVTSVVDAISQVVDGLEQISAVIQTNSATSEESAASSEELSGQAALLKNLVRQFKLSDSTHQSAAYTASTTSFNSGAAYSAEKY